MRLRWLLIAVVSLSVLPSLASARSRRPLPPHYEIAASIEPGIAAGTLVLAFTNIDPSRTLELPIRVVADTIQYDWLTVELSNATTTRTLTFVADREKSVVETVTLAPGAVHVERIGLDTPTRDLAPGDYDVVVTWDGHVASTKSFVPYRCGLAYRPAPPVPTSPPSKWPYALGVLGVLALVGVWLAKRAGASSARVPSSTP